VMPRVAVGITSRAHICSPAASWCSQARTPPSDPRRGGGAPQIGQSPVMVGICDGVTLVTAKSADKGAKSDGSASNALTWSFTPL
jgi:hypothetical protein